MNKIFFATLIVAVVATFAVYNMYNYRNVRVLSDIVKLNVEALSSPEYDGECVEWATKSCYDKFFSTVQDPFVYHATCSGSSQVGGYLECGAVTSNAPFYPYNPKTCLQCVRTTGGTFI